MSLLSEFRESKLFKLISDISVFHWFFTVGPGALSGIEAALHGKPLETVIAYFVGVSALAMIVIHYGGLLRDKYTRKVEQTTIEQVPNSLRHLAIPCIALFVVIVVWFIQSKPAPPEIAKGATNAPNNSSEAKTTPQSQEPTGSDKTQTATPPQSVTKAKKLPRPAPAAAQSGNYNPAPRPSTPAVMDNVHINGFGRTQVVTDGTVLMKDDSSVTGGKVGVENHGTLAMEDRARISDNDTNIINGGTTMPPLTSPDNSVHIAGEAVVAPSTSGDCAPINIGGSNTTNCGPPPLKLSWASSPMEPGNGFKYKQLVTVTTNVMFSPVSIAVICDHPIEGIWPGGGPFTDLQKVINPANPRVGMVYYPNPPLAPGVKLGIAVVSNEPFTVLEVKQLISLDQH
jgi:hypothetical protein